MGVRKIDLQVVIKLQGLFQKQSAILYSQVSWCNGESCDWIG